MKVWLWHIGFPAWRRPHGAWHARLRLAPLRPDPLDRPYGWDAICTSVQPRCFASWSANAFTADAANWAE